MRKATDKQELPPKEKHTRFLLLGCAFEKHALTFFNCSKHLPLSSQAITAWKFYYLVHRLIRESSAAVTASDGKLKAVKQTESGQKVSPILDDCFKMQAHMKQIGQMWKGQVHIAYANLVGYYSELIDKRLTFHKKFKDEMPSGSLEFKETHIQNDDIQYLFEVSAEVCDQLEMNLSLSKIIMSTMNFHDGSDTTPSGHCRLHPCTLIILDSSQLYDFLVKLLFKMHNSLPADVLEGHRTRFKANHSKLKQFYEQCSNVSYVRERITLPNIPQEAPDFLATAEFSKVKELAKETAQVKTKEIEDTMSLISVDDLLGLSASNDFKDTDSMVSSASALQQQAGGFPFMASTPIPNSNQPTNSNNELIPNLLEEIEHLKNKISNLERDQTNEITTLFGALSQAKQMLQNKDLEIDELKSKVEEQTSNDQMQISAASKQALGAQQLYRVVLD